MCEKKFTVIGISDSHNQFFRPDVLDLITNSSVFSGGKRHYDIMSPFLPKDALWIDVKAPLADVFEKYKAHDEITVFASGDPLFFGYAATLQRIFPNAEIEIIAAFNSLQMLAHRIKLPYQNMVNVSLTGRPWKNLDDALIACHDLIGCLTDHKKGPAEIATRMLDYGYDNYEITIGTALGNEAAEKVETMSLREAASHVFGNPNCIILRKVSHRPKFFGIPEKQFHHLKGRENMITKMPVRMLALSMLDLPNKSTFWDIGFCTGSVSVEARLHFPHLDITAFEIREESSELMEKNCRKFGTPSINYVIGDFMEVDISDFPRPDAVFIGGHGGRLHEMIERLNQIMLPGCVVVFNSVNHSSCAQFIESMNIIGKQVTESHTLTLDKFNPITILKAQ